MATRTAIALLFFAVLPVALFASAPVVTGQATSYVSYGSFRVTGTSDTGVIYTYVQYSKTNGFVSPDGTTVPKFSYSGPTAIGTVVVGVEPNTTYYYKLCAKDVATTTEGCSSQSSVTTLALPADRYARPTEPTLPTIPAQTTTYTTVYYIDPANNCNNGITGTQSVTVNGTLYATAVKGGFQAVADAAAALSGSGSIAIVGAGTTTCKPGAALTYYLTARTGTGYIDIRTLDGTAFPPAGIRLDSRVWPTSNMLTFKATDTNNGVFTVYTNATKYRLIGLNLTNDVLASSYITTTNVSAGVYTTPTHGWSTGHVVQIWNDTSNYITNCKITVLSSTTFSCSANSVSAGTVTTGAKVARDPTNFSYIIFGDSSYNASFIGIERCNIYGTIMPMGIGLGIRWHMDNSWIVDSTIKDMISWASADPAGGGYNSIVTGSRVETASLEITYGTGRILRNNYIDAMGITLFSQGGTPTPASHLLIEKNLITVSPSRVMSQSTSDRLYRTTRQLLELKQFRYVWIKGNEFSFGWDGQITGNFTSAIVFTPRSGDSNVATTSNGITDIIIENNLFHDMAGVLNVIGGDHDAWSPNVEPTKRIWFRNNVAYNIDGWGTYSLYGSTTVRGHYFYLSYVQDFWADHNTMWNFHGTEPSILQSYYDRHSGLKFTNNIFGVNSTTPILWTDDSGLVSPAIDNTGTAYARFVKMTSTVGTTVAADTTSKFSNNLLVSGVTSSATPNYGSTGITKATCDAMWTGDTTNVCATGTTATNRFDALAFFDRSTRFNFRQQYNGPGKSGAATKLSNDGLDVGADVDELEGARGVVSGPRLVRGAVNAIRYTASSTTEQCYVVAANSLGTGTPTADTTGTRPRTTSITVGSATNAYLLCPTQQFSCSVNGGSCTLLNQ